MKRIEIPDESTALPPHPECLIDGNVTLYRNSAGAKFGDNDEFAFTSSWNDPAKIEDALLRASLAEQEHARRQPFAWNAKSGYLSPHPCHCGNGMELEAIVHLEGLFLIGDLPPVLYGLKAMRIAHFDYGTRDVQHPAHIFTLVSENSFGITEAAHCARFANAIEHLLVQEEIARKDLLGESVRILADAVGRSLAVLRSARLLAPRELLDILSPLRLAAGMNLLLGIGKNEIGELMRRQIETPHDPERTERDEYKAYSQRDADLADAINRRFANVSLNSRAKRLFS